MLVTLTSGCFGPIFLRGEEIRGRVIDEAGAPLNDAAVAVSWLLTGLEGVHVRYLEVAETTTDERGDFRFASWGPRLRWPLWLAALESNQPDIWIFKPGYEAEYSWNGRWLPNAPHQRPWRQSMHDNVMVALRRHDSMTPEYIRSLDHFAWLLDGEFFGLFIYRPSFCSWEHIPHLIGAVLHEEDRVSVARPRGPQDERARAGRAHPYEFEGDYASDWANAAKYRGCKPLSEVVNATR